LEIEVIDEIDYPVADDETFDQNEAPRVIREYVCAVCAGELVTVFAKSHWRVLVVCPEHGSVTKCGRVTRTTINIEMERSYSKFNIVIRNLPELWGELIPKRQSIKQNLSDLGF
jgi:hypothetical protein